MSESKPRVVRRLLMTGVPIFAIAVAGYVHMSGGRYISTENAYVKAHVVRVTPEIDGKIATVYAIENQTVRKGDLLFLLDDAPFKLELAAAEAELDDVRQQLLSLKARHDQEQAELSRAEERIRLFKSRHARQKKLKSGGYTSTSKLDDAKHELMVALQDAAVLRKRSKMTLAELGGELDRPAEAHARFRVASAKRDRSALNLARTSVRAPVSGVLSNVALQPGERVTAGKPVFAIVDLAKFWLQVNLKEVQLTKLRIGQTAIVTLDAYPNFEWRAEVESISPATGSEFSLLPTQNASGNWVKVVQRVPVRLKLDKPKTAPPLRVGMTAHVTIDTGIDHATSAVAGATPKIVLKAPDTK